MLKVCENCTYRQELSYEDLIPVCGKCREVKKADLVEHASPKDPFKNKRWTKGRQSKLDYNAVKKLRDEKKTLQQIADIFGVSHSTILNLLRKGGK